MIVHLIFMLIYRKRVKRLFALLKKHLKLPKEIEFRFTVTEHSLALGPDEMMPYCSIWINPLECWRMDCSIEVAIAHEAKHVEQFHLGKLQGMDGMIYWEGIPYASSFEVLTGRISYHRLPWEVEAMLFETWVAREYGFKPLIRKAAVL